MRAIVFLFGVWFLSVGTATEAFAQSSIFANQVVSFNTNGNQGGGIFNTANALGAPQGGGFGYGSLHVHTRGVAGHLTLGLGATMVNGPGADFIVSENPFMTFPNSFNEMMYVEVSSNGLQFARFPALYHGPDQDPGAFGMMIVGSYNGMAGSSPVFAGNASYPNNHPQDVVGAGGDAFDLQDLVNDPLVLLGQVQLNAITQVRLVDARNGVDFDSRGRLIRDVGGPGSAEVDAVTVINHSLNQNTNMPRVQIVMPQNGNFIVHISDPNGLGDLDLSKLRVSMWGAEFNAFDFFSLLQFTSITPTGISATLGFPLPPGFLAKLSVAIQDYAGNRSGDSRSRPEI